MSNHYRPGASAHVDIVAANNATLQDALQFDPPQVGVTGPTWTFSGQKFRLDIAANHESAVLLSLTSDAGEIVVDDVTNRILHFNVPEATLTAALIPGIYYYDFIMYDDSVSPAVRVQIAHGKFVVTDGITEG
jgi:hypothetical protein